MERMKRADKAWRIRRALAATVVALSGAVLAAGGGGAGARPGEDKPRVECKMQCATDRQKCEAACPAPAPAPS